jgi:hypothetical protein
MSSVISRRTAAFTASQPSAATSGVSPPWTKTTPLTRAITGRRRSHWP